MMGFDIFSFSIYLGLTIEDGEHRWDIVLLPNYNPGTPNNPKSLLHPIYFPF